MSDDYMICMSINLSKRKSARGTYRVNAAKRESGREHANIFPVQLFLLLTLNEDFGQTVWDILAGLHALFDGHDHATVHFQEIVM
jgi:hypothetical protein